MPVILSADDEAITFRKWIFSDARALSIEIGVKQVVRLLFDIRFFATDNHEC